MLLNYSILEALFISSFVSIVGVYSQIMKVGVTLLGHVISSKQARVNSMGHVNVALR